MNYYSVINMMSVLIMVIGTAMGTAVPAGYLMHDDPRLIAKVAACAALCFIASLAGFAFSRTRARRARKPGLREGFASVGSAWAAAVLFGALPFYFAGGMYASDAIFETASGFSTTGASVIYPGMPLRTGSILPLGLESVPYTLLFWRSLLNWLGGIGIVMFVLIFLPLLGGAGGQQLYNAEVPGLKTDSEQITPRITSTSRLILSVYFILTALAAAAYFIGGMQPFDAICHSFSTIATGGFSTKSASMGFYTSPFIQWTSILFMTLAACNFALTLKLFVQHKFLFFRDEEFKFFISLIVLSSLAVGAMLYFNAPEGIPSTGINRIPHGVEPAIRTAAFQIVSMITTTGFATSDYTMWNLPAASMLIFIFMFFGGCGGSTSGGLKCVRFLLALKQSVCQIRHCIFPRVITDVRLNGYRLDQSVVNKTMAFIFLYTGTAMACAVLLPFLSDMDMMTAISAAISSISNVGPGFGAVAPSGNYGWMSDPAKYLLSFTMIAGRLELYTFLVMLMPSFWKK